MIHKAFVLVKYNDQLEFIFYNQSGDLGYIHNQVGTTNITREQEMHETVPYIQ